jgi:hypothetical protein
MPKKPSDTTEAAASAASTLAVAEQEAAPVEQPEQPAAKPARKVRLTNVSQRVVGVGQLSLEAGDSAPADGGAEDWQDHPFVLEGWLKVEAITDEESDQGAQ